MFNGSEREEKGVEYVSSNKFIFVICTVLYSLNAERDDVQAPVSTVKSLALTVLTATSIDTHPPNECPNSSYSLSFDNTRVFNPSSVF